MKRETKVGLAVAVSFVCLVGGVFATKYLHGPKSDATPPIAQSPAPDKQPGGDEAQHAPPPDTKGPPPLLDLGPIGDPPPRKPAAPPPDLDLPLGPPGGAAPAKPMKGPPPLDDPNKDDVFNPAPAKPVKPTRPVDDGALPLMPVPSGPVQPKKPAAPPPDLDLPLDPPATSKDKPKAPPKMLPPVGGLDAPPNGGVTRVANPPADIPGLDLDLPAEKKPADKKDEKNDKLPPPAGVPNLDLPPPSGSGPPNLPAPNSDPKNLAPAPNVDPKINIAPMPNKPGDKKMDPPPPLTNPKPSDVPPPVTKDVPKMTIPGDTPAPLPKQPAKPAVDPGSSMLPKDNNAGAASLGPKVAPDKTIPPPEARVDSYDEEWYYCKQGDTLESISQKFFFSSKYEQALRQYQLDRNYQASFRQERPALSVGQVVKVPPARILEAKYPATLPGFRPTANTKPDAGGPTTIPPTGTADTEFIGQAREYEVKRDGMTFKDIAREEFRDERQWTRIFNLNREWNPNAPIPKGTRISLPRAQ